MLYSICQRPDKLETFLLQVFQAKSLNISNDCDSRYLGFLLQGDQLEESEGRSEEKVGGDVGGLPLAEPQYEDSPPVLVSHLRNTDKILPPHNFQLTGGPSTHEGIVISYLMIKHY